MSSQEKEKNSSLSHRYYTGVVELLLPGAIEDEQGDSVAQALGTFYLLEKE